MVLALRTISRLAGPRWMSSTARPLVAYAPQQGTEPFNVVLVGAGNIMFGSDEGPWNHSFRLEQ